MATRSRTDLFQRFRDEAVAARKLSSCGDSTSMTVDFDNDRAILVGSQAGAAGPAASTITRHGAHNLPPEWVDGVEEIQFELTKIKQRVADLQTLHRQHLDRPTLDDDGDGEQEIDILTREITSMFHRSHKSIQQIGKRSQMSSSQEKKVTKNVMSSMALSLQEMSVNFRSTQSAYLKRLKNREEREQQIFSGGMSSAMFQEEVVPEDEVYDKAFTTSQLGTLEDNSAMVEEREREITSIVQSIGDLNEIFRDLATMIAEQGTVLDRIDYNIELAAVKIEDGHKQLVKAEKHQKSSRKMLCILVLAVIVIGAGLAYIGLKASKT
ncbi:syntaxin-16-like [Sycon ciliatum]|uniref:syntaxin-16-like n=1 Tax=Sycon ciliatum TaxID=27933 RepID=UPI0031F65C41